MRGSKTNSKWSRERGFTLVELLIVIAIIGVLAALGLPHFLNARYVAMERAAEAHAYNTYVALTAYLIANPDALELPDDQHTCHEGWTSPDGQYSVADPQIKFFEKWDTSGCAVHFDLTRTDTIPGPNVSAWVKFAHRPERAFTFGSFE